MTSVSQTAHAIDLELRELASKIKRSQFKSMAAFEVENEIFRLNVGLNGRDIQWLNYNNTWVYPGSWSVKIKSVFLKHADKFLEFLVQCERDFPKEIQDSLNHYMGIKSNLNKYFKNSLDIVA